MRNPLRRLEKLLKRERDELLVGNIQGALALLDEKERLVRGLENSQPEGTELQKIQTEAARNLDLIKAAWNGITAARSRIEVAQSTPSLRTYGADGHSSEVSGRKNGLERRA